MFGRYLCGYCLGIDATSLSSLLIVSKPSILRYVVKFAANLLVESPIALCYADRAVFRVGANSRSAGSPCYE
jgi:hypothetical protein